MDRRRLVPGATEPGASEPATADATHAPVNPPRCFRAHRRTRRYASTRVDSGRLFWVVPAVLAAGWELVYRNRVVLVRETRIVKRNGHRSEIAIVEDSSGYRYPVEILREDNAENSHPLEGSIVEEPG